MTKKSILVITVVAILLIAVALLLSDQGVQEPQANTNLPLLDEKIIFDDQCVSLEKQIKGLLEEDNYCNKDSDCQAVQEFWCPFGLWQLVNKAENLSSIRREVEQYNKSCLTDEVVNKCNLSGQYDKLVFPPSEDQLACRAGRCVEKRFETSCSSYENCGDLVCPESEDPYCDYLQACESGKCICQKVCSKSLEFIPASKFCQTADDCTLWQCTGCVNKEWASTAPPEPPCANFNEYESCDCINNKCQEMKVKEVSQGY